MKTYIGTKIIQGEPMSENDFLVKFKGAALTSDITDKEGYRVVYPDGYVSWSPKEAFENAYREITPGEFELIVANNP